MGLAKREITKGSRKKRKTDNTDVFTGSAKSYKFIISSETPEFSFVS